MDFEIRNLTTSDAYKLAASLVVPRPIALVTSLDEDGTINAAPFSFFNLVGSTPLVIALGIANGPGGRIKDSRANIVRTGEFVVNLVDEALATAMNVCAVDFPTGISELEKAHLTQTPSNIISVPYIAESPAQLECKLHTIVEIGDNRIILAEVVALRIRDAFVDLEHLHVRTEAMHLIGRMQGGGWYARTSDLFEMPRHTYAEWLKDSNPAD